MERVLADLGPAFVYATTEVQNLPFNTLFQLVATKGTAALAAAEHLLLLPDLFGYWLTGAVGAEVTNASTTQLLDASTRGWSTELITRTGLPAELFPPLRSPGDRLGELTAAVAGSLGL